MKERLKQLRKTLGFSQQEMAARLGMQQTTYSRWETTGNIKPSRIQLICQTFGVPRSWLENGEGELVIDPPAPSVDSGSWQFMQRASRGRTQTVPRNFTKPYLVTNGEKMKFDFTDEI